MMEKAIQVAVVIPVHNAEQTLRACIQSVLDTGYADLEVVVVDDASTDSSMEIAASFQDPRIVIVNNQTNLGPAGARNRGVKAARGGLILFVDSDTRVDADCIEQHVRTHQSVETDLVAGAVQGIHETVFGRADGFCSWWTSVPGSRSRFIERLHVPTTNMSMAKELFDELGQLNEEMRVGEDSDFSRRALRRGKRIFFNAGILAHHHDRDSLRGFLKHQYDWGTGLAQRRAREAEFSLLIPKSRLSATLLRFPLAFLYSCFIVRRWVFVEPEVVLYFPLLFLGKMAQTTAMRDSFRSGAGGEEAGCGRGWRR